MLFFTQILSFLCGPTIVVIASIAPASSHSFLGKFYLLDCFALLTFRLLLLALIYWLLLSFSMAFMLNIPKFFISGLRIHIQVCIIVSEQFSWLDGWGFCTTIRLTTNCLSSLFTFSFVVLMGTGTLDSFLKSGCFKAKRLKKVACNHQKISNLFSLESVTTSGKQTGLVSVLLGQGQSPVSRWTDGLKLFCSDPRN